MRDILFRGKTDAGRWVYGSLVKTGKFCCILQDDDGSNYDYPYLDADLGCIDGYITPVDSVSVGQYIGIQDKNNQKIFEGDIVKFHMFRGEPDWVGVVVYDSTCLYILVGNTSDKVPFEVQVSARDKSTFEVIGNVIDNPEILEVK